jgi:hypothetical protein
MVAITLEAVDGAICRDVGDDAIPVVCALVERLGLNNHPLLLVTLCDSPPFAFRNIQLLTNVLSPSSLTWGTPGTSTRRAPGWLIGRGSFLSLECA